MEPIVRIYESEEAARDAVRLLTDEGFEEDNVFLISPSFPGGEARAVRSAIEKEQLPGSYARVCTDALQRGRVIVSVVAPFGAGQTAMDLLDGCDAVETATLPDPSTRNPAPFSDFLGLPTLSDSQPSSELSESAHPLSQTFGLPVLSNRAAPLSSMVGMKTVSAPKRQWRSSMGMPLLSKNAAPLSSMLRMKTLSAPKRGWKRSFGMPLLSRNPAPMSSLLGLRTLSRRPGNKNR